MNSNRPIYPVRYNWESNGDYLIREWNNVRVELWHYIAAGFTGKYTYPFAFRSNPVVMLAFQSTRASTSYDKELCAFNVTPTSCEFSQFTVPSQGGQGGWVYLTGEKNK